MNDTSDTNGPTDPRPLGYWLRVVDRLISAEFARALADEGVDRRDWMLLNAVAGKVDAPWLTDRLARRSGRVRRLAHRGWIAESGGVWSLTDEGTTAFERLGAIVDRVRDRVTDAVSPEDFATTRATLEAIAEFLGGVESSGDDGLRDDERHGHRGPRFGGFRGRGFVPGFAHGFDHEHGFERGRGFRHAHGHGFGPTDERCAPHHGYSFRARGEHGHGHGHEGGYAGGSPEHAYERGFTAGFERGQAAASEPVT